MMIGTCGHEISMKQLEQGLLIRDYTRLCERCVSSLAVCDKCRQWYEAEGVVVHNDIERKEWFEGND